MANIPMLKLALPFISFRLNAKRYVSFSNAPKYPKKDLHIHRSYCIRKSFLGRKWGRISVRWGWTYISHWNHPESACSVLELRSAWNYFTDFKKLTDGTKN